MGFTAALQSAKAQGALMVLAHPYWSGNTLEDVQRWAFDGVEIYNHVCHWLNGKSEGLVHWNAVLRQYTGMLALAVDDAHLQPEHLGWNGGWIMVNADACTPTAILTAIRTGNFYARCGPVFQSIVLADDHVQVETSPVQYARLVGPRFSGMRQGKIDSAPL